LPDKRVTPAPQNKFETPSLPNREAVSQAFPLRSSLPVRISARISLSPSSFAVFFLLIALVVRKISYSFIPRCSLRLQFRVVASQICRLPFVFSHLDHRFSPLPICLDKTSKNSNTPPRRVRAATAVATLSGDTPTTSSPRSRTLRKIDGPRLQSIRHPPHVLCRMSMGSAFPLDQTETTRPMLKWLL
jgi:hypothetical protein